MRPIALCVLLPLTAFAQTSPPPSTPAAAVAAPEPAVAPPQEPRWSIGAGVFSETTTLLGNPAPLGLSSAGVPGVAASLERRLSERTWLVIGVAGAISRTDQDLPSGYSGTTRNDVNELTLSGGARYVMTPAAAPVDVSAVALLDAAVLDQRVDENQYVFDVTGPVLQPVTYDSTGWRVGASFGVAVDRVLAGSLSLRLATPLLGVHYTSTRAKVSGGPTLEGSDFAASVVIAPRLELRLAF